MTSPTVDDGHEVIFRLQLLLQHPTSGDRLLALAEDQWSTERYEQAASDHINKFQHRFQDPGAAGHCHESPVQDLVDKFLNNGLVKARSYATSSVKAVDGSTPRPIYRSALVAPLESCPSLASDHSSDGQDGANDSPAPRYASATPATSKRPARQPELSMFTSIRQVLSSNLSFAEKVISAVSQLPHDKRNLLFESETECVDGSSSRPSRSPERPFKKRRTSGNSSNRTGSGGGGNGNGNGDPPGGRGGAGDGSGNGDGDGVGRGGSEGGDGTPHDTKRNKDKQRRWICPYYLAYPEIYGITLFSNCSPGNMTEVHLWRSHLNKYHSPKARDADPNAEENAMFYMDPDQWDDVKRKIESYKGRPRLLPMWISYWKALFIDVWRIIFPRERFSHFKEPDYPFHFNRDEIANLGQHLGQKTEILVGSLWDTLADEAVKDKPSVSKDDYRPTAKELKGIISDAIAIVLRESPAATGATQRLARASDQTLKAAGGQYEDDSKPQSKADVALPYDVPAGPDDDGPSTPSRSVTAPGTPSHMPSGPNAVQEAPPDLLMSGTFSVPLFPGGTQVVLSPVNPSQIDDQVGQLTLPPTFYPASISPIPWQLSSMAPFTTTPGTPADVPQQAI
ncbi:hypothetical protein FSARC_8003 [Fusarium sarcochroum]|uniref:Uncharacterized protein n=1 Tax=Fusarium sarcochroum TaxID=1208366 RepID=A0A8H4X7P6_9HYPO|nr:hypothetical protein FSARC_8003 [Fusarium sarcochroum]